MLSDKALGVASTIMRSKLNKEAYVEFAMSYYEWVCVLMIFAMLLVILMPVLNRTVINLRNKRPFGAGFKSIFPSKGIAFYLDIQGVFLYLLFCVTKKSLLFTHKYSETDWQGSYNCNSVFRRGTPKNLDQ